MSTWPLPPGVELPTADRWPVTLRAGALVLRPLRRRDNADWQAVRRANADWLRPWDPTPPPFGNPPPRSFASMVRIVDREARAQRLLPWAIAWDAGWPHRPSPARDARLIGQLSVSGLTWGSARAGQIGYWIDQRFAGRGITPAAVALACDYVFAVLHLHRIEICIRPENTNSLRVASKLALRSEGFRPQYLHIDGAWTDHQVFAVHSDEASDGMLVRVLAGRGLPGATGVTSSRDTPS